MGSGPVLQPQPPSIRVYVLRKGVSIVTDLVHTINLYHSVQLYRLQFCSTKFSKKYVRISIRGNLNSLKLLHIFKLF